MYFKLWYANKKFNCVLENQHIYMTICRIYFILKNPILFQIFMILHKFLICNFNFLFKFGNCSGIVYCNIC